MTYMMPTMVIQFPPPPISPTQQSSIQKGRGRDGDEEGDNDMYWRMTVGGARGGGDDDNVNMATTTTI